jgi:hypothetical protein
LRERIRLDAGRVGGTYRRFAQTWRKKNDLFGDVPRNRAGLPLIPRERILRDVIRQSPGDEGKWIAAAKELGPY